MCGIERRSEKRRRTQEQYIEDVHSVNPYIDVVGEYIDNMTPISHKCKIDGNIWTARPNDILNGKGCPQCNESHGERCVRLWLDNLGVSYVREKHLMIVAILNLFHSIFTFQIIIYALSIRVGNIMNPLIILAEKNSLKHSNIMTTSRKNIVIQTISNYYVSPTTKMLMNN